MLGQHSLFVGPQGPQWGGWGEGGVLLPTGKPRYTISQAHSMQMKMMQIAHIKKMEGFLSNLWFIEDDTFNVVCDVLIFYVVILFEARKWSHLDEIGLAGKKHIVSCFLYKKIDTLE